MEMRWWLRSCNELPTYPVLGIKPERSSIIATSSAYLVHVQLPIPLFPDLNVKARFSFDRSNSACGLDSVELELDFVFTSSSDSKQLDFGQGYLVGSRSFYWA
ncbi:unnamed protein product [Microthlaspi erraticum]|uniref:Uncharacterized protein n=1 Tax=Microthlaspi erraticum TaxID=1685480 RepID=A0A6D2LAQ1_9BRAS|nr:unnamed protein product [Microthlaspi erraticum]